MMDNDVWDAQQSLLDVHIIILWNIWQGIIDAHLQQQSEKFYNFVTKQ